MDIKATLKQLSEARGPYGQEGPVAELIIDLLRPLCDEVRQDEHFNVYGLKQGTGPEPRPRLMLMAHMDEIHMLVSAIDGPFLRFHQFVYDTRVLVGQKVLVLGKQPVRGVIGDRPPHVMNQDERKRAPAIADLVIDVDLDADSVAETIRVGDPVLIEQPLLELLDDRVAGKAFDNRLSVTSMLATLENLQHMQHPCDIVAIADVGEEHSGLGAYGATYQTRPDIAIVLDVTFAHQPGAPDIGSFELGGGPVIGVGPNLSPAVTDKLIAVCDDLELSYGIEPLPANSGTDAWKVQVSNGGVPTGLVGIAIRNMHTPVEIVALKDVSRLARLLAAFAMTVDQAYIDELTPKLPDYEEEPA